MKEHTASGSKRQPIHKFIYILLLKIVHYFQCKPLNKEARLKAAAAKVESIAMDMRELAREVNSDRTIISGVELMVIDHVCHLFPRPWSGTAQAMHHQPAI